MGFFGGGESFASIIFMPGWVLGPETLYLFDFSLQKRDIYKKIQFFGSKMPKFGYPGDFYRRGIVCEHYFSCLGGS